MARAMRFGALRLLVTCCFCACFPAIILAQGVTLGGKFRLSGEAGDIILDGGVFTLQGPLGRPSGRTIPPSSRIIMNGASILRLGNRSLPRNATYKIPNYIQVNRGIIESLGGDPEFTGHVTIGPGGAQFITHSGDISFDADLTGAGPLSIDGVPGAPAGTVRLDNDFSFMGAMKLDGASPGFSGGRIFLGASDSLNQATLLALAGMRGIDFAPEVRTFSLGALSGGADIDLKGKTLRVGVLNTSFAYSGNFTDSAGGGAIIKSGSGTMTLSGVHAPGVAMSVYYGTLVVDGAVGGEIKVGDPSIPLTRAVLTGTGATGNILLQTPGAIVEPGHGDDTGVLAVRGFSMIPGSTLSVRIAGTRPGPRGYDQVRASGQFSIYGNLQLALARGFRPRAGDVFYIMTTTGAAPVLGRFGNVVGDQVTVAGRRFHINYSADSARNDPASTTGHDIALIALP